MSIKLISTIVLSAAVATLGLTGCSGNQPGQSKDDVVKSELAKRGFTDPKTITSNGTITSVWISANGTSCRWRADVYTEGMRSGQVYVFYTDPKTGADRVTIDPPNTDALKAIPALAACWSGSSSASKALPTT